MATWNSSRRQAMLGIPLVQASMEWMEEWVADAESTWATIASRRYLPDEITGSELFY